LILDLVGHNAEFLLLVYLDHHVNQPFIGDSQFHLAGERVTRTLAEVETEDVVEGRFETLEYPLGEQGRLFFQNLAVVLQAVVDLAADVPCGAELGLQVRPEWRLFRPILPP
jgi:hypothetical protein